MQEPTLNPETEREFDELYNSFQLCDTVSKQDSDRLKQFIAKVEQRARQEAVAEYKADTERLDFLDKCNRGLNERYGTNYGWELILNHNVTRLMIEGHISWVDLHDSKAGNEKLKSCRDAIDKKMEALSSSNKEECFHGANLGECFICGESI